MRPGQARILGLHLLQERLADAQIGEVEAAQVAPQQAEQVDQVARAVSVLGRRATAELVQQRDRDLA